MKNSRLKGTSLVEAVVGVVIIVLSVSALVTAYNLYAKAGAGKVNDVQTAYLLEEGQEAIYFMRDSDWMTNIAGLVAGTKYYFVWDGFKWASSQTPASIDNFFDRYFILEPVYRDGDGDIVSSGSLDAGTRKATVYVSWSGRFGTTTKSVSSYVSNLFGN